MTFQCTPQFRVGKSYTAVFCGHDMILPPATFFAAILEEVGYIAMGLGKLELKRESVKGQEQSKWPHSISSAVGGEADIEKPCKYKTPPSLTGFFSNCLLGTFYMSSTIFPISSSV